MNDGTGVRRIASAGGEVVIATDDERRVAYDTLHFAPARRAGNVLYVSGVIVRRLAHEGNDEAAFRDQTRRAFRTIEARLHAAGATFADVALINSFHVWTSPNFAGDRDAHFRAFAAVKDEFVPKPYPAWTAVGSPGLMGDGLVEIQVIAHLSEPS